jgi:hypothetical protein
VNTKLRLLEWVTTINGLVLARSAIIAGKSGAGTIRFSPELRRD